jgi:hypothetical protein
MALTLGFLLYCNDPGFITADIDCAHELAFAAHLIVRRTSG